MIRGMGRILFVQQYLGDNREVGPIFPIGLAYLATAVKPTGWGIRVFDMNVSLHPYEELDRLVKGYRPDVIGISLRNIDNVDFDEFNYFYHEFQRMLSSLGGFDGKLVVGGAGFSIFAEELFARHEEIDYGIVQEGEETIVELLDHISKGQSVDSVKGLYYRDGSHVVYTGRRRPLDFSRSPIPDRSFFQMEKYLHPLCVGVQTKRGCRLKCSYCPYPFLAKNLERFRDPLSVVDEIEQLKEKYGVSEIIFCDDIFNAPIEHAEAIIQEIIRRGVKIRWSAWFDVSTTTAAFIRLAILSGCYRFCFSTEGVTDCSLQLLQKDFNSAQISRLLKICSRKEFSRVVFRFSVFAMPPGQTTWGMLKTVLFVLKTHILMKNSKCLVSWIRVLPHTKLYDSIKDEGIPLLPEELTEQAKLRLFYNSDAMSGWKVKSFRGVLVILDKIRRNLKAIHLR